MTKAEVVSLLGKPHIQSITTAELGLTSPTAVTYTSTNSEGTKGLAMILYAGDRVVSKKLTYIDPQKATGNDQ